MAKGYRPSDDPGWRHEHEPTGEVRQCSRKGCKVRWPVFCHTHTRIYCYACGRAVRRVRDRQAKADKRFTARAEAEELRDFLDVPVSDYTAIAAKLRELGFDYREAKRLLAEWVGYFMDDDEGGFGKVQFGDWVAIETDVSQLS
jgi:hypothetical protein